MCRCSCARGTGNSSDKVTLAAAVEVLHEQLRTPESDPSFFVADSGIYSEANIRRFNESKIHWISRVPETNTQAKAVVEMAADRTQWQDSEDGQTHWFTQMMSLPQGQERLSSSCAPSREKRGPRPPSSERWRKPSRVGSKSSGTCPTSISPAKPMRRMRWLVN
jgi:hypothetical protein